MQNVGAALTDINREQAGRCNWELKALTTKEGQADAPFSVTPAYLENGLVVMKNTQYWLEIGTGAAVAGPVTQAMQEVRQEKADENMTAVLPGLHVHAEGQAGFGT